MYRFIVLVALALLFGTISSTGYSAEGARQSQILDPAVHNLTRLEPLRFGSETDNSSLEPREYRLKVGQGYRWKIQATPGAEYAFVAPAFFRNIWIRKVEAGDVEIKAATLDEIEFENRRVRERERRGRRCHRRAAGSQRALRPPRSDGDPHR